jgi:hypothetical protein
MSDFNAQEFAHRWKDVWSGDIESLERLGARQRELVERAPQAWLRALLSEIPAKTLWEFLNDKSKSNPDPIRFELRQMALRGFQPVPPIVRQKAVQNRLFSWLDRRRDVAHLLLLLWAQSNPQLLESLGKQSDEAQILPVLRAHGALVCWLGAAALGEQELFERIETLLSQPDFLERAAENEAAPAPDETATQENPDSNGSDFWREQAQNLEAQLEHATRELKGAQEQNLELETLRERLRASAKEIERLKKEERQKSLAASKKLELAQSAAQTEIAGLKKHDERETRRAHAAEKQRDELDSTVKVLRKQVRHLNQLLDAEQKKIMALEARLAQREKPKDAADPKSVDAVSTPRTTQKTADAPVKVARPTPLDELFRWMADGHEFRATPRETMRSIDRNDVEFAFRVGLALEGIASADLPKKTAFLRRLREQDPYYAKVLTEPTQRALVDASNVVRSTKNKRGKGELRNLLGMKKELRRLGFFPIEFIADASLRYNVDDINAYNEMINRGEVEAVTPGTEADEILVRKARSGGGYVVTNDAKFHFKVSPDLAPPSVPFRVFDGTVIIDEF